MSSWPTRCASVIALKVACAGLMDEVTEGVASVAAALTLGTIAPTQIRPRQAANRLRFICESYRNDLRIRRERWYGPGSGSASPPDGRRQRPGCCSVCSPRTAEPGSGGSEAVAAGAADAG